MIVSARSAVRLPSGVRDFLPRATARRRSIAERLLGEFESWGYARIITPLYECADVLERGLGVDARQAAIRFVEPGTGEVVALRPDMTPQVARMAATHLSDIDGPLRYCYEGAVTRMQRGTRVQREILQAGVELIGAGAPEGDAEVLSVAVAALATMGLDHVRLDLGHVALVRYALAAISQPGLRREIEALLAKKAHREVARLAADLPEPLPTLLGALPTLYGNPDEVLARARALPLPDSVLAALSTVEKVLALSREVAESELHATISLDLGEVRGFEYYTGTRFDGYAEGVGEPVLRGGRYDELLGRYGHAASATGFAVDIEAIAQAQSARGVALPAPALTVLVTTAETRRYEGIRVAAALRAQGLRAAVDPGQRRGLKTLLRYAAEVGFTHILRIERDDAGFHRVPAGDANAPAVAVDSALLEAAAAGEGSGLAAHLRGPDAHRERND
ncbi:ATP phosphoribosyltransferase regulatory subunit [Haliangium ochraceum]|uniref:ATP phosphoribosyltransferase regulatory subunit n=1 Tax=Haliangium ochraceum (strain DSM 14365 / JCM 11303 / SMP-2) TaxID=502025 RepID=D0LNQ8_HALO1|nr:ATP phosphoribosyltransferase regulatory subunit [Haliangium ochraceum]ACY16963.1 histidyl-tRNA synthetase 2 [Haliangium ochraceum DSM 14365]